MPTYQFTLEYDGREFSGWQYQPQQRTVEGALRNALTDIGIADAQLTAAGRTDAGVHAHGHVVGCTVSKEWNSERLQGAVNARLPEDVVIRASSKVRDSFHARFDALDRTYRYVVLPGVRRSPTLRRYAWEVRGALDVSVMRQAAKMLCGTHDFRVFGRSPAPGGSTVRTVSAITITQTQLSDVMQTADGERAHVVVIEVRANAFLRGMMRGIASLLVDAGRGRITPAEVAACVSGSAVRQVSLAPAHGLHQWKVTYPVLDQAETTS